tara:strand:+ start:8452 stop:8985 length:534 start_codon:yes stop_codon:yes gene_type:complete
MSNKPENTEIETEQTEKIDEGQAAQMAASLDEFDRDEGLGDYDPAEAEKAEKEAEEKAKAEAEQAEMDDQAAQFSAVMAINTYESTIQMLVGSQFKLSEAEKQKAVDAYGPVIKKYGPAAMGWFAQWKDEIMASVVTGSIIMNTVRQVKNIKAEKAANQPKAKPKQGEEKPRQKVAA